MKSIPAICGSVRAHSWVHISVWRSHIHVLVFIPCVRSTWRRPNALPPVLGEHFPVERPKRSPDIHYPTGHQGALTPQPGKDPKKQVQKGASKALPDSIQDFLFSVNHMNPGDHHQHSFQYLPKRTWTKSYSHSHTLSHTYPPTLTHAYSYILILTNSHSHNHIHRLTNSCTHSHTHTVTNTHTLMFPHFLWFSLFSTENFS
jgi:hypothetical protein